MKKLGFIMVVLAFIGFAVPSFAEDAKKMTGSDGRTCSSQDALTPGPVSQKIADEAALDKEKTEPVTAPVKVQEIAPE